MRTTELLDFVRRAGTERSTAKLFSELARFVTATFGAYRTSLYVASDHQLVPFVSEYGTGADDVANFERWRRTVDWRPSFLDTLRSGVSAVLVTDPSTEVQAELLAAFDIMPFLALGLSSPRDFLGVLVVEGDAETLERQHDDLVDLAAFFTLALDNARAFEGQLARRREAETFAAISAALAESTDLHRVLSRVAKDAAELTGFERGTVLLLDESENVVPAMSRFANDDEEPGQWEAFRRIPSEDLAMAFALVGGEEPRILPTAEDLSVVVGRPLVELFHLRSVVILPLVAWEERFGVLILDRSREGAPTSEQMQLATTVAAQAAVAIGVSRTLERERALVARLRELDDLKNTFIASISHELRTPLTSIIGFAGLLESTVTDEDEREFAGYIVRESRQLENLIGNLLDASRIEAGRLSLDIQPVDLAVIIGEAVDLVGYVFPDRVGDLTVQAPPLVVDGDPARLRQVLTNLVENAAKYTSPGVGIEVTLTSTDAGAAIAVSDHGPGIPATEHEAIFDRFYRIAGSGRSGTGIGLFLVRQLVEAHGGAVRCESGPDGTGTRFVVELPTASPASHFSPT